MDVENPDLEKFPRFADAMKCCIQLVLKPGDMLFIPGKFVSLSVCVIEFLFYAAMWAHNVRALTPCVSVNVFWRHLDPALYQKKDLYGNKVCIVSAVISNYIAKFIYFFVVTHRIRYLRRKLGNILTTL